MKKFYSRIVNDLRPVLKIIILTLLHFAGYEESYFTIAVKRLSNPTPLLHGW